jgi:hypothetical protein
MIDFVSLIDKYLSKVPGKTYLAAALELGASAYFAYRGENETAFNYFLMALTTIGVRNAIAKVENPSLRA